VVAVAVADMVDVASLRDVVDELVRTDPGDLYDAALADELISLRAQADRIEAQFARLSWVAHQRGIGAVDGAASTAAWLSRRTGMRQGEARTAIEAGSACDVLADTSKAWLDGSITGGAARTILGARVEGHDGELRAVESIFLELARDGAMGGLARACGHFRACAQRDGTEPRDHDGFSLSRSYNGRVALNGNLSSSGAEIVVNAIHALTDPPSDDDRRTASRRRADALVQMAELALAHLNGAGPDGPTRARPSCSVVIDWPTLLHHELGRMDGDFTGTLHRSDVERLLCDCTVSRVVTGPTGLPIDVGRQARTVSPAMRRALVVRDDGCRYPGCRQPTGWCDAHHIIHWQHDGPTDLDNLVLLCDHHHAVVHQPGWTATFQNNQFHVHRPDGTEVT
jgi:hypothetical protein